MKQTNQIIKRLTRMLFLVAISMPIAFTSCGTSSSDEIKSKARNHFSTVYEGSNRFKIDTVLFLNASVPYYLTDKNLDKVFRKVEKNIGAMLLAAALVKKNNPDGLEKYQGELSAMNSEAYKPLQTVLDSVNGISSSKQNIAMVAYSPIDNSKDSKVQKVIYILGEDEQNLILDSIQISKDIKDKACLIALSKINIMENLEKSSKELEEDAKKQLSDPVLKFIAD